MKFILIYVAVSQFLMIFGLLQTTLYFGGYPACEKHSYPPKRKAIPWYTINLDAPPQERWKDIMIEKGAVLRSMVNKVKEFIKEIAFNSSIPIHVIDEVMDTLGHDLPSPLREEIEGIAKYGSLPFGEAILFNVFYDLNPLCTSIIAQAKNGTLYHARNLDYGYFQYGHISVNMTQELRDGAMNVRYMKNGAVSFVTTTYVGYAGVVTGMKPNAYTFSFNARLTEDAVLRYLKLIEYVLGRRAYHWVTPTIRHIMENVTTFNQTLTTLASVDMVAPVYYIVGGTKPGEGCILTKGENLNDLLCLSPERWYVLQTNFDHWGPPGDDRRYDGQHCMNQSGQANAGFAALYNVLSTQPVLNSHTTYTTLMQVHGSYDAYVRYPYSTEP